MSGKLVILRHKSWHVWNQDNREKVLRDERIHREQLEQELEDQKKKNADFQYELLKGSANAEAKEEHEIVEPFRLFDDPSDIKVKKEAYNEEYMREKKAKDLKELKRQGVAPMPLGDSSGGSNPILPWYVDTTAARDDPVKRRPDLDEIVRQERIKSSKDKDRKRKRKQDPMNYLLKYVENEKTENETITQRATRSSSSEPFEDFNLQELRRKRLEREKLERKKAQVLLTDPDVNERYRNFQKKSH